MPFASLQPNLGINFATGGANTRTQLSAYDAGTCLSTLLCTPVINPTGCLNTYIVTTSNPILNAPTCTAPTLGAQVTNVTCAGGNDGAVDLTITGGSPTPLSIIWSNGATTEDISSLTAGVYEVTVTTNGGGCTANTSFTVGAGAPNVTYFADGDGDTYGNPLISQVSCTGAPLGYVLTNTDCDDSNGAINPGAAEVCNSLDDDCDGQTDEGLTLSTWYADADGDSYGNPLVTLNACAQPLGYVSFDSDCDDNNIAINPGATEVCDLVDNDCDGLTDEGVQNSYYTDFDGDNFGTGAAILACTQPNGTATNDLDCNDNNAAINPNAVELCNNLDDDCDGNIDEGLTFITYYADVDGDTFGDPASSVSACTPPSGYVTNNLDCNDGNPAINPLAIEVCDGVDNNCNGTADEGLLSTYYADGDGDGYGAGAAILACTQPANTSTTDNDCDDNNNAVNPGALEVCNGIDDDCDGTADDGLTFLTYYVDADVDGFGDASATGVSSCNPIAGSVTNNGDCNDANNAIYPGATEICNSIDDDCDGSTDEGLTFTNYYSDLDLDTYGSALLGSFCSQPLGSVAVGGDCDDNNPAVNPGASEACNGVDDDCNGLTDDGLTFVTYYADGDNDTYGNPLVSQSTCNGAPAGYVVDNTDCNDTNPAVNPAATEVCNGIDDDCDGSTDEGLTFANYYADVDGDTYGGAFLGNLCAQPLGSVTVSGDCDDNNNAVNPGALEVCNGIDDDCNSLTDDGLTFLTYYVDADGDGFGDASATGVSSCNPIFGSVTNNTDCNDGSNAIFPGAPEQCNGIDDDCDGQTDEGVVVSTWYQDADGDTYGNPAVSQSNCAQPVGYVLNSTDCNDGNAAVNPGALEVCNSIDDDCDGSTDEGVTSTFYADADGDTYGNALVSVQACSAPVGYVADATDCDDTNGAINPGAAEVCNSIDDDCDGQTDEGLTFSNYYVDADNDTYGDANGVAVVACAQPSGYVLDNTDCNDGNAAVNPGATEVCNSIDDDCDGLTDEGVTSTFYADADGDNYGNALVSVQACTAPVGYVADATDCDDTNGAINPGATEVCDLLDNDCDGLTDEGVVNTYYADADGDTYGDPAVTTTGCSAPVGYVSNNGDCDDTNGAINPGAAEVCNNIDDNCNGLTDDGLPLFTYYADADGDTYGNASSSITTCVAITPVGYVLNALDCDDNNGAVNPGATEICANLIDDNCDGNVDEGCGCVNPPTANAGSDVTICAGQTTTLNGSIGGGATNGTWSTAGDGSFSPSASVLNATYTPGPADILAGSAVLTLTTDAPTNCTPATSSLTVTIQDLPPSPGAISGPAALCNPFNQTVTYSVAAVPGATSYTWSVPAGTTLLFGQGTTSITVTWPFSNIHNGVVGQVCVTANNSNSCGSGTPSCLGISVQLTTPVTPPSISGSAKACPGETVTYSVALVARADNYVWSVPAGASVVSGQNTNVIQVQYSAGFTGGPISVIATNACGSSPARTRNISLNILPASTAISGQGTGVCGATGVAYTANPVVGALSYLWNVPTGATIMSGQGTATITVDFSGSYGGGSMTVIAQNGCGNGAARALTVLGAPGQASPITGPTALCANQNYNYGVATIAGAATYTWTVPSGFIILSGQGTKDIVVKAGANPAGSLSISVRASNACGTGPIRSLNGISITLCPRIGDAAAMNISAYPNPVSDLLNVSFNSDKNQDVLVTMMDAAGRVVLNENRNADEGANKLEFSVKGMAAGIYTMQFRTNDTVQKIRIVVE